MGVVIGLACSYLVNNWNAVLMGIGSNTVVVEPSEQGIVEPSIEQPDSIEDNLEYIRRMKDRKMVIFDEPKEINTTNVFEIF